MNNQTTNPISTIEDTYGQGLTQSGQIKYNFSNGEQLPKLQELDAELESIINFHKPQWGINRGGLQKALREDNAWKKVVEGIVEHINPGLLETVESDKIYAGIETPDWPGVTLASSGDLYDPSSNILSINGVYSHNIFKQIRLANIDVNNANVPIAQTNIVFVEGGKYAVMGLRGGMTWAKTFHGLGSGAIQPRSRKNDPVFDTVYGEIKEEVNLSEKYLKDVAVAGKVIDNVLGRVVVYISKCDVDMTLNDFIKHWNDSKAEDKAEHTDIKAYDASIPEALVKLFAMNGYKKEYVDVKNPKIVTPMNAYTILPNSVSGIIPALAAQFNLDREWIPYAVNLTDGVVGMSNRVKNCYK
ncbi:TPA: hypothetical protein HA235_04150 [Candidatus Woesearchaeota archaeon]|nr:hypothetical protein [uncultured archaeon]MBS3173034.1 hypothetical protein [Candidatus Woesearchaeota archaeon]AQS32943.1 hypothetical protein [uncultured archaeon]HIH31876.1 hypothetical protein [Candidatus Woesearchaeota archaeon]HIH54373.1 hypothetical protein [Candidatus Woesearchaeota archaeon]